MRNTHGAIGRIYALTAVTRASHHVDSQVVRIYLDLAILYLRHNSYGNRRGMHATLAFSLWYALDAVSAAFEF